MNILVEELAHSYKVRFPYSPQAVEKMKTIPGRAFRKDLGNCWLVPKTSEKALRRFLKEMSGEKAQEQVARPYDDPEKVYPTRSKTKPWPHQLEILRLLWNKEAAIVKAPMGTGGKSRIIVDYVCNKADVRRVLIVCPKAVIPVWPVQFEKHAGLPVRVVPLLKGTVAEKQQEAEYNVKTQKSEYRDTPLVLVINYDSVWRDPFGEWAIDVGLDLLVLDETQRAKSPGGEAAKYCYRLGSAVPVRFGLSGTPFPHSELDVYGVCRAIDPSLFGTSKRAFDQHYFIWGGFENRQVIGRINVDQMQERLARVLIQVDVDESALPDEVHTDLVVELPEKVRRTYRQLENDFYAEVESGEITAANGGVALTRLQQLTSGAVPTEDADGKFTLTQLHTGKQDALCDFLVDLPDEEPVVVFCRFRRDLEQVHAVAAKLGRTSSELSGRRHELEAWQRGETTILATQLRAGAVGVDMTRAHIGVYFSYTYSLEEYSQSLRRLRRPGQTKTCAFYHLVVAQSVDLRIRKALERRQNVIDALLALTGKEV